MFPLQLLALLLLQLIIFVDDDVGIKEVFPDRKVVLLEQVIILLLLLLTLLLQLSLLIPSGNIPLLSTAWLLFTRGAKEAAVKVLFARSVAVVSTVAPNSVVVAPLTYARPVREGQGSKPPD